MIAKTRLVLTGLSAPTRVLAFGTVALGCLVIGSKVVAFAQDVVLPSILRPTSGEIIDGPDPYKPRAPTAETLDFAAHPAHAGGRRTEADQAGRAGA